MVDVAAQALHLDDRESAALRSSVKASATTDNSLAVFAGGSTPAEAAENVNAVAAAFLQYRADIGRADMNLLAERAHAAAKETLASAVKLEAPLAKAQGSKCGLRRRYPGQTGRIRARGECRAVERGGTSMTQSRTSTAAVPGGFGRRYPPDVDGSPRRRCSSSWGSLWACWAAWPLPSLVVKSATGSWTGGTSSEPRASTDPVELGGERDNGAGELLLRSVQKLEHGSSEFPPSRWLSGADAHQSGAAGLLGLAAGGHASLGPVAVVALRKETGADIAHQLGMSHSHTPLSALSGRELANVNSEIGCEASAVFGTTPTPTGTYDLLLQAPGPHFEVGGFHDSLPAGFAGPTVLVVQPRKDRVQNLEQAVDELNAANLRSSGNPHCRPGQGRGRFGRAEGSHAREAGSERTGATRALRSEMQNAEADPQALRTTAGTKS